MSVVIIGGHDRMVCKYKEICKNYKCKAKIFTQMPAFFLTSTKKNFRRKTFGFWIYSGNGNKPVLKNQYSIIQICGPAKIGPHVCIALNPGILKN